MKRYLNLKSVYGTETIDELDMKDFKTFKEFKKELFRLRSEYYLCNMFVYISQRSTKDWRSTK
jgi:hypothetical protein